MKHCGSCNETKPFSEFTKNPARKDGYHNQCKPCRSAEQKRRRAKYRVEYAEMEYQRNQTPHRKEQLKEAGKRRNPKQVMAVRLVNNAVRSGLLIKPDKCSMCHDKCRVQGHHHDYDKPLDVIWVCIQCHGELHGRVVVRTKAKFNA